MKELHDLYISSRWYKDKALSVAINKVVCILFNCIRQCWWVGMNQRLTCPLADQSTQDGKCPGNRGTWSALWRVVKEGECWEVQRRAWGMSWIKGAQVRMIWLSHPRYTLDPLVDRREKDDWMYGGMSFFF